MSDNKYKKHIEEALNEVKKEFFLPNLSLFKPFTTSREAFQTVSALPSGIIYGSLTLLSSLNFALFNTLNLGLHFLTCRSTENPKLAVLDWLNFAKSGGLMMLLGLLAPLSLLTRTGATLVDCAEKCLQTSSSPTPITIIMEEESNGMSLN